jgi:hypothetical protein
MLSAGDSGMDELDGSGSSLKEVNEQVSTTGISEVDRLKKWNKDFENLPDVQTWNRACVALQATKTQINIVDGDVVRSFPDISW